MQEEYAREGIDWSYVEFIDNQDCLDLLEGSANAPSMAVFPLIDEACRLPRATYQVRPCSHTVTSTRHWPPSSMRSAGCPALHTRGGPALMRLPAVAVFSLIDEACRLPRTTYRALLS